MRHSITLVAVTFFWASFMHEKESGVSLEHTVQRFVEAFNRRDSAAMADFVADDVSWLSITGADVAIQVTGKSELVSSMNAYFESCPSCRSELSGIISTSDRVSAIEVASWQGESGPRSQSSIAVYEFSQGLIQRVYYFPSEAP
jgi:hypothetical protein